MILKALEQWLNTLLKFIDNCKLRGSYNAGYNRIILYQNQITILALDGKLQIKKCYKTLISTNFYLFKVHSLSLSEISELLQNSESESSSTKLLLASSCTVPSKLTHSFSAVFLDKHPIALSLVFIYRNSSAIIADAGSR